MRSYSALSGSIILVGYCTLFRIFQREHGSLEKRPNDNIQPPVDLQDVRYADLIASAEAVLLTALGTVMLGLLPSFSVVGSALLIKH